LNANVRTPIPARSYVEEMLLDQERRPPALPGLKMFNGWHDVASLTWA